MSTSIACIKKGIKIASQQNCWLELGIVINVFFMWWFSSFLQCAILISEIIIEDYRFLTTVDYKICRALAKNCDAPIDNKKGAEAKDWRKGKPVRVVRNCKGRKHSKYAPEEGNRYDGIYKVKFLSYNFNNTQLKNDATIL